MSRSQRFGWILAAAALVVGGNMVAAAVRTAHQPGADVPVVCVMAQAAREGQPVPYPHAWERRCS